MYAYFYYIVRGEKYKARPYFIKVSYQRTSTDYSRPLSISQQRVKCKNKIYIVLQTSLLFSLVKMINSFIIYMVL